MVSLLPASGCDLQWLLVYGAALVLALAAWRPAGFRFACKLAGRGLELAWLYFPLVPLLALALVADRVVRPAKKGAGSWTDAWWACLLRRMQRGGPVVVKLGQWAATRPDMIPEEWCEELKKLHDSTEAHALSFTHRALDRSFPAASRGSAWHKRLFIEPQPVGSGCIAQVYLGHLMPEEPPSGCAAAKQSPLAPASCIDGLRSFLHLPGARASPGRLDGSARSCKVAVKVVHPQVQRSVDTDLRVLYMLAGLCERVGLDHLGLSLMLRQFADFLMAQTNLVQEAKNLRSFRERLGGDKQASVVVPEVFDDWVARDVLVMSFETGEPLSELMEADANSLGKEKLEVWRIIVDLFWAMVFKHRFVHGDMHPGNLLWRRKEGGRAPQIVLLDCGLSIDLGGQAGEDLSMMVKAFLTKSEEEVARLLIGLSERVGGRPEDVWDPDGFVRGIADLIRQGKGVRFQLSRLNAGALMGTSLLLGRKHCVRFDARFVNLMVAMVVLQGVALRLHGDGDIIGRMMPYVLGAAMAEVTGKKADKNAGDVQ